MLDGYETAGKPEKTQTTVEHIREKDGKKDHPNHQIDVVKYMLTHEALLDHMADYFDRVAAALKPISSNDIEAAISFGSKRGEFSTKPFQSDQRYIDAITADYKKTAIAIRSIVKQVKLTNDNKPIAAIEGAKHWEQDAQRDLQQVINLGANNNYLTPDMVAEAATLQAEFKRFVENSIDTDKNYDPLALETSVTNAMRHIVEHSGKQKGRTSENEEIAKRVDDLTAKSIHEKIQAKAQQRGQEWAAESDKNHSRQNRFAQAVKDRRAAQENAEPVIS
jgi:hypothetical protein